MTQCSGEDPVNHADQNTQARLAAIETNMRHIETLLPSISQSLDLAIGFLAPGQDAGLASEPSSPEEHTDSAQVRFRVFAHLSRDGQGARLVPDVSWTDMWSVRLFVTALLRNMARSGLVSSGSRCWCEVWAPDETGELVDSAFLEPDTGTIDWESDLHDTGETP